MVLNAYLSVVQPDSRNARFVLRARLRFVPNLQTLFDILLVSIHSVLADSIVSVYHVRYVLVGIVVL